MNIVHVIMMCFSSASFDDDDFVSIVARSILQAKPRMTFILYVQVGWLFSMEDCVPIYIRPRIDALVLCEDHLMITYQWHKNQDTTGVTWATIWVMDDQGVLQYEIEVF